MIAAQALVGGFADAVFDSQAVFRHVLDALSRPGRIVAVLPFARPPAPLLPSAAAVIAALADEATPVFLDATLAQHRVVADWITFHTGAPITTAPSTAAFAVIGDVMSKPSLGAFLQGTDAYPDRSTTVIAQAEALSGGEILCLAGPGIDGEVRIAPRGLPPGFVEDLCRNRSLFPRGVDLVLASPDAIVGLPRSVRVKVGEA